MAKYIDADVLKKKLTDTCYQICNGKVLTGFGDVMNAIDDMPTADVEPVRHGKWIKTDADFNDMPMEEFKCSVCGNTTYNLTDTTIPLSKYCDGCGSKMDGGSEC